MHPRQRPPAAADGVEDRIGRSGGREELRISSTRFFADNGTPLGDNPTASSPIARDGTPEIGKRYTVPAREGRAVRLLSGQSITIINTHGTQVCDLWAFNAENLSEYLSWEHTRGGINPIAPEVGDALLTNRRRPTCG